MTGKTFLPAKYSCVMVIDDNPIDQYIARHNLKEFCIAGEVMVYGSSVAALAYLQSCADGSAGLIPDIILLDIHMPEMDGFDFLMEYEKLPAFINRHCQIIMLSSSIDPSDHERLKNNPFVNGFIGKPLNRKSLVNL